MIRIRKGNDVKADILVTENGKPLELRLYSDELLVTRINPFGRETVKPLLIEGNRISLSLDNVCVCGVYSFELRIGEKVVNTPPSFKVVDDTEATGDTRTLGSTYVAVNVETTYTPDYRDLAHKPQINGVELNGNKSLGELGIQPQGDYLHRDELPDLHRFVMKEAGKGLSSNDFTDEWKQTVSNNRDDIRNLRATGGLLNRLDQWNEYDSSKATWALSAMLGYDLNERHKQFVKETQSKFDNLQSHNNAMRRIKWTELQTISGESLENNGVYEVMNEGGNVVIGIADVWMPWSTGSKLINLVTSITPREVNDNTEYPEMDYAKIYRYSRYYIKNNKTWGNWTEARSRMRIVRFKNRIDSTPELEPSSTMVDVDVTLCKDINGKDLFVATPKTSLVNPKYYPNWNTRTDYQTGYGENIGAGMFHNDTIYLSDDEVLIPSTDGASLVQLWKRIPGQLRRVEWSGERVQNPTIERTSTMSYEKAVLATNASGREFFVVEKEGKYYSSWVGVQTNPWQEGTGENAKFYTDVLYVSEQEVLVSAESRDKLVSLTRSVWIFRKLMGLTTSSTETEVAEALGVKTTVDELSEALKRYTFIDEEYDESGAPIQRYSCLVDFFDSEGVFRIIVEKAGSRRVITFDERKGTNHIESIEDFVYKKEPTTETVVKAITPSRELVQITQSRIGWQPVLVRATASLSDGNNTYGMTFGFPISPNAATSGSTICYSKAETNTKIYEMGLQLNLTQVHGQANMVFVLREQGGSNVKADVLIIETIWQKSSILQMEAQIQQMEEGGAA